MNTNNSTVKPVIARIKIALDMHKDNFCCVRQQEHTAPEPAQRFRAEAFYAWLARQLTLAEEVYVCYEAGCFGYEPARRMEALGVKVLVIAPQNWDEQHKRQVNDKFDAQIMCRRLSDYLDGHRHAPKPARNNPRPASPKINPRERHDELTKQLFPR